MPYSDNEIEANIAILRSKLPLEEITLTLPSREWRLTVARDQDALMNVAEDLDHFPYGFLLWESAIGLARYMEAHPERVRRRRVLELGAGLGFAGLVARSLGAQVWQTDHLPLTLALARLNAKKNDIEGIEQFVADWRNWEENTQYDVLLGADILYEKQMHWHLDMVFQRALAPHGILLLGDPQRAQAFQFITQLENQGWHFDIEMMRVSKEGGMADMEVAIYVGQRRE